MKQGVVTVGGSGLGPWSTAGIRDYWLDGSHHTRADREVAERILEGVPHLAYMVCVYRMLLGRAVRYLVSAGVRQFLDLGSGLPTEGNVHRVAQNLDPGCRVVYVDIDSEVVAESRKLLADNHNAATVLADLREPEHILDTVGRCGLLDFSMPVAVLAIDVLHHVPDIDKPARFIAAYVNAVCPGSYVFIAHTDDDDALVAGLADFYDLSHIPVPPLTLRGPAQIAKFFEGLEIVEPGIVPVPLWHPELGERSSVGAEFVSACCGLGQKL